MRMGIGLGVGINRSNYAQGIFNAYSARVVADGGVVESGTCVDAVSSLLQSASLLLIPSGYKGGKLYSEIPTNGNGDLTWTRGGDAFRTNASGVIQRVPWNLASYSEEFSNAYWAKSGSSVSANVVTAPNGTTTADSIIENTSNSTHLSYNASAISAISGAYTFSVYMKKNTRTHGFVQIATDTASKRYTIVVDLNSGSVTSTTSSGSPINPSNTITNVGDEWYRISVTATNTSGGLYGIFGLSDSATPTYTATAEPTYLGNGTSGLYIWGAQLVEGTTAQTYLPTTDRLNFPRLSYMYGSCPSALLEPQRTNLALWSEDFSQTTWAKTRCSITANSTTAPDGNTTADTLVEDTTATSTHPVSQAVTLTAAAQTFSIYAKAANRNWIQLTLLSTANASAYFNLSNGTIGTVGSATTASIVNVGNGWYRCIITATTAAGANTLGIYPASADATSSFTGNGTASLYIWGAQCE